MRHGDSAPGTEVPALHDGTLKVAATRGVALTGGGICFMMQSR